MSRALLDLSNYLEDEEEEEEEEEEEKGEDYNYNYNIPSSQSRIQISPRKKVVAFDPQATQWGIDGDREEQMDVDAANQLQTEDRQARSSSVRSKRSRSPNKRSVSRVDSHRDPGEIINQARRSTSGGPAPASSNSKEISGGQMRAPPKYPGAADPIPPEYLTPQERKDNELDAKVMDTLQKIRDDIHELCTRFFYRDIQKPDLVEMVGDDHDINLEFINFCRAIAEGGGDARTWQQVVTERNCRLGLSYGIIHRVLVRHVFGSLLFGGPPDLTERLEQMEKFLTNSLTNTIA